MMTATLNLFKLSLRQLLGRQRLLLLVVLTLIALIPSLLAAISLWVGRPLQSAQLFADFDLPVVLPLIALIVSGSLLREEIHNQTIVYLITKPISRLMIVLGKFAAGLLLIWALGWLGLLVQAAVLAAGSELAPQFASVALITLAYGAFYLALSLFFKRALLWGLAYLIVWEGVLANLAPGIKQLSIHQYAAQFSAGLLSQGSSGDWSAGLGVLLAITIVSLALAAWHLSRMEFAGETD